MSDGTTRLFAAACALAFGLPALADGWVTFRNETASRLPTPSNDPAVSTADVEEKE
jgi:hypothetical protein